MTADEIAVGVRSFLRTHVRTLAQLEVLLLLARDPSRSWSAEAVNKELRSSLASSRKYLRELTHSGLLGNQPGDGGFRFAPQRPEDQAHVRELAKLYKTRFYSIIDAVYTPNHVRDFADAFKLRKDDDD